MLFFFRIRDRLESRAVFLDAGSMFGVVAMIRHTEKVGRILKQKITTMWYIVNVPIS